GSWPTFFRWAIVILAAVLLLLLCIPRIVAWATSHFVVTTDRVIHRSGWFAKESMEIPLDNINDVKFHQSVFERMIGGGDLTLESAGTFGQTTFGDVRRPERVQKVIYDMTETKKRRLTWARRRGRGTRPASASRSTAGRSFEATPSCAGSRPSGCRARRDGRSRGRPPPRAGRRAPPRPAGPARGCRATHRRGSP